MPESRVEPVPARAGKRRFRRRLRTRIVMSFSVLAAVLTLLFAFAAVWASRYIENKLIEDAMNRNIEVMARSYATNPTVTPTIAVDQMYARAINPNDPDAVARLRRDYPGWAEMSDGIEGFSGTDVDNRRLAYKVAARKTPTAWFFLAYDTTRANEAQERLILWLFSAAFVFILLSLLIGWWSASRVMSPISALVTRLRAYRGSSTPTQLGPLFPEDEVGELARALDDYSARLTEVVQRDREFNADVSHELRTPLAVIKGAVELLLSHPDLSERTRQRLLRVQRAEQQCSDLIGSLLLLSRNERGQGSSDVARVAEQLIESHRAQIGHKPLELVLEKDGHLLVVDAPEAALSVALGNLIGNAVKYTQEGRVLVRLLEHAVEVVDSGPGLSEQDAARLFDRGYRGTHAGHSQGGGIGLSIVRRLCDLYDWQVSVRPGQARGVVATLDFRPAPASRGGA